MTDRDNGQLREPPSGVKILQRAVDSTPVTDPDFWRRKVFDRAGDKLQLQSQYAEHPWVYAALRAISEQLTQAPFSFYVEQGRPSGSEPGGRPSAAYECEKTWTGTRWVWAVPNPAVATRHSAMKWEHRARADWRRRAGLVEIARSHWVELFERPNPAMTGLDLWELTAIYLGLLGECFWIKTGNKGLKLPRVLRDLPRELWPMHPGLFKEVYDKSGRRLVGWQFAVPGIGGMLDLDLDEVVHFRLPNPLNQARGQAPLEPLTRDLQADRKIGEFNLSFLDGDGEVGGVIIDNEGLLETKKQRDQFETTWEERHAGAEKRGRLALLWGGLQYVQTGSRPRDLEYLGQLKWSREAVLAVLGVPETAIAIYGNLPYASAIASQRAFWTQKIIPLVRRLESTLWMQLFPGPVFGLFDLSAIEALAMVMVERLGAAQQLSGLGYPANDVNDRLDLGMPPKTWGDVGLGPAGLLPMEDLAAGLGGPTGLAGAPGTAPATRPPAQGEVRRKRVEPGRVGGPTWRRIEERVFRPGERTIAGAYRQWVAELAEAQARLLDEAQASADLRGARLRAVDLGRRWGVGAVVAVALGDPAVDHVLAGHCALDVEAIRRQLTPAAIEALLFNSELWGNRVATLMTPAHAEVAGRAITQAQEELGGLFVFDVQDPALLDFLATKAVKIRRVADTMRNAVRSTLIEGLALGESIGDLQRRVAMVMANAAGPVRTLRIARTETAQTQGGTRDIIFREEGIEQGEWVTAGDEVVREDHVILGTLPAEPIGYNYMERLGKPGTLEYPSDVRGPAGQVINCRCVLLPVV